MGTGLVLGSPRREGSPHTHPVCSGMRDIGSPMCSERSLHQVTRVTQPLFESALELFVQQWPYFIM